MPAQGPQIEAAWATLILDQLESQQFSFSQGARARFQSGDSFWSGSISPIAKGSSAFSAEEILGDEDVTISITDGSSARVLVLGTGRKRIATGHTLGGIGAAGVMSSMMKRSRKDPVVVVEGKTAGKGGNNKKGGKNAGSGNKKRGGKIKKSKKSSGGKKKPSNEKNSKGNSVERSKKSGSAAAAAAATATATAATTAAATAAAIGSATTRGGRRMKPLDHNDVWLPESFASSGWVRGDQMISEEELLTPGNFAWTTKYPLTTYFGANTCSHYSAATKILRRWLKKNE